MALQVFFFNVIKCGSDFLEHLLLAHCQGYYLQIYPMLIPFFSKNLAASKTSTTLWPRVWRQNTYSIGTFIPSVQCPGDACHVAIHPNNFFGPRVQCRISRSTRPSCRTWILTWCFSTPKVDKTNDFCASIGCKAFPSHARFDAKQENMVFTVYIM